MNQLNLTGKWQLSQSGTKEQIPANIPGDNHSALLAAGKIPDPYFRKNEIDVQCAPALQRRNSLLWMTPFERGTRDDFTRQLIKHNTEHR